MDARTRILMAFSRLDQATYYQLLSVEPTVDRPTLQRAFHRFALAYHPDRHVEEEDSIRDACRKVFQRGVEAYSALRDPKVRPLYDRCVAEGRNRLSPAELELIGRRGPAPAPRKPRPVEVSFVDSMKTEDGREVAQRVERMMAEKRLTDAYQQIGLLETIEPGNPAVKERAQQLSAALKRGKR
jgi:DnaJ-class molecular chaperone